MSRFPELPASVQALEEEILERWREEDTFRRSLERPRAASRSSSTRARPPPTGARGSTTSSRAPSRTRSRGSAPCRGATCRAWPAGTRTACRWRSRRRRSWGSAASGDRGAGDRPLQRGLPRERAHLHRRSGSASPRASATGWTTRARTSPTTADYVESVWWLLKQIAERGLFYRGHKILPYCPRCGTGLSSHEVAQGYRDVKDPSLYFTLPVSARTASRTGASCWCGRRRRGRW
jgi:hypothetical protein